MSTESYLRTETVHIDEVSCAATGRVQWFAENRNKKGSATHPITHNNRLAVYICGQAGFAAIARDISEAKESIDLVLWGFDPGMELNRTGTVWPRSTTYGDLLIAAARRGVKVRLLCWHSYAGGKVQKNMPGYTHGTSPWRAPGSTVEASKIDAQASVTMLREHARDNRHKKEWNLTGTQAIAMAREEYCHSWFYYAFKGWLTGIEIRTRGGDSGKIQEALDGEKRGPAIPEGLAMKFAGTHHQKPILIDFAYEGGKKAVGYVMGLNSVTGYWDTASHCVQDSLREDGGAVTQGEHAQGLDGEFIFASAKPYRDYACRISAGQSLIGLHENFERAWLRAGGAASSDLYVCKSPPVALLRKAESADSTVQIVRTQPEENDLSIKDIYFKATDVATAGTGYLYIENQYFQYKDWADHLLAVRKKVIAGWNRNCEKIGKTKEDLPMMYLFIVIPAPELAQMIPRTYDTLATLGQQDGLKGQVQMIDQANKKAEVQGTLSKQGLFGDAVDRRANSSPAAPVIEEANNIQKPSYEELEKAYGLRVCVAVLNSGEYNSAERRWRYREIYIHSKLMLVDDSFLTLGSANLNQRSMVVDSEINIATNDPRHVTPLRKAVWAQLTGGENDGGKCTREELKQTSENWLKQMKRNKEAQKSRSSDPVMKKMLGFIVPLDDTRSSVLRLG
jgi:phosphatidylserine/phosphatidylglycerophosphate/cardiolipin synthase-like enzyme